MWQRKSPAEIEAVKTFDFLRTMLLCIIDWGEATPSMSTVICNGCHEVKTVDGAFTCNCGGTFEPFANWEWVDDSKV